MELIHALNRGVDGREIFLDSQDYARFVQSLFEFNDQTPVAHLKRRMSSNGDTLDLQDKTYRRRMVDVHGWCLMKNHYHLLLSERVENGLTSFLRKLNIGYAKYFNEKYKRVGALFQGRTKKIHIKQQSHFLYILHYIHLNPLDYFNNHTGWRHRDKGTIQDTRGALEYLEKYRWSSYLDYCRIHNFPSVLTMSLFNNRDVFGNYQEELKGYIKEIGTDLPSTLTLE